MQYLIGYLLEVGPALPGSSGAVPITQGEIRAWQENTSIRLTPWEVRTLRLVSQEYVGELRAAAQPDRNAPFRPSAIDTGRRVAQDMRSAIRAMAAK